MYFNFDPFTGGKKAQPYIGEWPGRDEAHTRWAARSAEIWRAYLTWSSLVANLALNGFYTDTELARWGVHFSFLSAFTHPNKASLDLIYGRNSPKVERYDHYASELILLYVITIARLELEVFEKMTHREPTVGLRQWEDFKSRMERGALLASHLWFPSGPADMHDRVQEANRRGVTTDMKLIPLAERTPPDQLAEDEIHYYRNPLRRIIALHMDNNEMTGFQWRTSWPRRDALARSLS